jgi:bifunctional non-homologous end joining protein LigD
VNLGCIAVHVWGSRAAAPRRPDWICFDLDPASGQFADAARAAKQVRRALDELGLQSFPKTSGGKGLHIFVPIRSGPDTDEVLRLCAEIGQRLATAYPAELTVESRIADRGKRVYLDAYRNAYAQTVVAPFSVRLKPLAPVSTPLDWSEVTPTLDPRRFNVKTFDKRLAGPDPWESFSKRRQSVARILASNGSSISR